MYSYKLEKIFKMFNYIYELKNMFNYVYGKSIDWLEWISVMLVFIGWRLFVLFWVEDWVFVRFIRFSS